MKNKHLHFQECVLEFLKSYVFAYESLESLEFIQIITIKNPAGIFLGFNDFLLVMVIQLFYDFSQIFRKSLFIIIAEHILVKKTHTQKNAFKHNT